MLWVCLFLFSVVLVRSAADRRLAHHPLRAEVVMQTTDRVLIQAFLLKTTMSVDLSQKSIP